MQATDQRIFICDKPLVGNFYVTKLKQQTKTKSKTVTKKQNKQFQLQCQLTLKNSEPGSFLITCERTTKDK